MDLALFYTDYFIWHYTRAFRDLLHVWLNFFWFFVHLFSLPLLFRTLFSPFKRVTERHDRPGLEDYLATIVVNVVTRIVGSIARLCIIAIGLVVLALWSAVFVVALVFWAFAPFALGFSFLYGLFLLI